MRKALKTRSAASWLQTAALMLSLFLLNIYICRELFGIEYLRHMVSIEGNYIALARHAMAHWSDLTWFPLWAAGVPYQTAYPPLLPLLVALFAWAHNLSPAHAYHWVTALMYCLGPIALFALALRLSGSRWAAFVATLTYSSISLSAWLVPGIARDLGSPFFPRRLQALVFYGEGPHVSSMTLLMAGLLCLDVAMERRRAPYFFLATVALAATALTNWLGAFAILLIVIPYAISHLGTGGWKWREFGRMGMIGIAAYCLSSPLMPPSTIAVFVVNARTTAGDYSHAYWNVLPDVLGVVIALALIKVIVRHWACHLQFAILFAFLMALLTLANDWLGIAMVPQAARYHLEMEMALAMLVAFGGLAIFQGRPRWITGLTLALLMIAVIQPVRLARRYARDFLIRPIDIQQTIEWKKAQWLNQHWMGGRVQIVGSSLFWWAAFSDIPELWGVEFGTTDSMLPVAEFAIYNSDTTGPATAANAVLWLKAFGVQALGVSGPASPESYKLFRNPKVFEGVLEPIWREGDDIIYRVGNEDASLARVVPRTALASHTPLDGLDVDPIRPYVAALDDPTLPRTKFSWTSMHSASIATNLAPGQLISLQMAWSHGWHAIVNGRRLPVERDAIGLMYIDPSAVANGPCHIDVVYDGGAEMLVARTVSILTLLLLVALSTRAILSGPVTPRQGLYKIRG